MQLVLLYNPEKCSGCLYCMAACAYKHYGTLDIEKSFVTILGGPEDGSFIGIHCAHCEHPACMAACPKDAITKDEETGLVLIDHMKCIGCRSCNYACPVSIPRFDEELRVSVKCDFCGGDPYCVKFCTTGAMSLAAREEARKLFGGGVVVRG